MESRYELLSGSISCMYHDIQKIERVEMAKYGLKGPHAQCLLAMKRHPEGITAARLCEALLRDNPDFSMAYIRFLSDRIRFLNKRLAELSAPAVEQRLAKYLSECDGRVSPNMVALASSLGIGRASLYRMLDDFIRRGLIRKENHDILILDPDGIKAWI